VEPQPNTPSLERLTSHNVPLQTQITTLSPDLIAKYGEELVQAYSYAYEVGITTITHIDNADMYGNLTRAQAAKMLSQFAIKILGKTPDTTKIAPFSDIQGYGDLTQWMETAYQLGLMGIGITKFNPNATMTRAEF
jgi:diketogulonate reductase-like aldo/keto reductase